MIMAQFRKKNYCLPRITIIYNSIKIKQTFVSVFFHWHEVYI